MPTVYGVLLSPFVRKVRLGLAEKGIDYELEPIAPIPPHNETDEFRAMSPLGKVPAFRDGSFAISDSSVILAYLERKHPSPPLYPAGAEDLARALWFEELADSRLADHIGAVFFNRVVKPRVLGQEPDPAAIDAALAALPPLFDYLEGQLGDSGFLVGDGVTIADLATGSMLRQYGLTGETLDGDRWPKLAAYYERLAARPAFAQAVAAEDDSMRPPGA